jgi:hypothetical protein
MEDWRLKVMINAFYAVLLSKKGGKEKNKVMYGGKEVEALKVINKSFFVTKEEGNNPWPLVVHQNIFFYFVGKEHVNYLFFLERSISRTHIVQR